MAYATHLCSIANLMYTASQTSCVQYHDSVLDLVNDQLLKPARAHRRRPPEGVIEWSGRLMVYLGGHPDVLDRRRFAYP